LKDGEVLVLDARKLTVFAAARDRRGPVNVVKFSPDSKYLAAGAETECVDFYDVTNLKKGMPRVGSHVGEKASGGISTLDWSVKSLCIQADTTDFRHMVIEVSRVALPFQMTPDLSSCHFIYRTPTCSNLILCSCPNCNISKVPSGKIEPEKQPGQEGFESHVWSSWTSVLGSEVRGIWPKDANKADINCCDLAHSGTALATGDDWGHVKLFPFPCPDPEITPFGKYPGHSAHVTNVKFSFDDRQIVSAGGKDNCLFVWHTEPGEDS
jgi:WD40 repeat protein